MIIVLAKEKLGVFNS